MCVLWRACVLVNVNSQNVRTNGCSAYYTASKETAEKKTGFRKEKKEFQHGISQAIAMTYEPKKNTKKKRKKKRPPAWNLASHCHDS
jgi:hypothetical protein